jgi:purine-binding chemotaxis protein CheW
MAIIKSGTVYDTTHILEEMREQYWQGLSEVTEVREEEMEALLFTLGNELFAFETTAATEVIRLPRLVRVPKVPPYFSGVFNLRGGITAAIDIRSLLNLPTPPFTKEGRIIVLRGERFTTGLMVEGVLGVEPFPLSLLESAPPSLSGRQREFICGQLRHRGRLVMLLDIQRLLEAPELTVGSEDLSAELI